MRRRDPNGRSKQRRSVRRRARAHPQRSCRGSRSAGRGSGSVLLGADQRLDHRRLVAVEGDFGKQRNADGNGEAEERAGEREHEGVRQHPGSGDGVQVAHAHHRCPPGRSVKMSLMRCRCINNPDTAAASIAMPRMPVRIRPHGRANAAGRAARRKIARARTRYRPRTRPTRNPPGVRRCGRRQPPRTSRPFP